MSGQPDEPVSQNGVEPEPKPIQEPKPIPEPRPEPEPETEPEPVTVSDPKLDGPEATSIQSSDEARSSPSATQEIVYPELRKDQGNRTFTMRELLNGLKTDQGNDAAYDTSSPYSYRFFLAFHESLLEFFISFIVE